jgi:tripartite-type tricarboxylate transporter receptor subunit TctC
MIVDLQPALKMIREGKVRALGVTTQQRVAAAPDIPTLAESGLAGFELAAWQGLVAPAGTPRPIIDELVNQIDKLLADPATRERLVSVALEPIIGSKPETFASYIKTEGDRWAAILRNSGVKPE